MYKLNAEGGHATSLSLIISRRLSENGYFPQSLRQAQIIILEILQCIPVVIIFAFLDLEKNISFSGSLLAKREMTGMDNPRSGIICRRKAPKMEVAVLSGQTKKDYILGNHRAGNPFGSSIGFGPCVTQAD